LARRTNQALAVELEATGGTELLSPAPHDDHKAIGGAWRTSCRWFAQYSVRPT
jgi:hypothetical protein